ncbi:MAG: cation transporting ATPase C-terminal domain-containing protein [Bacteroidota bacterium]
MLNNLVFLSLVLCQLIHVFNIKLNQNESYFLINLKNKYIWIAISTCIVILIFSIFNNTLSQLIFNYKLNAEEFIIPIFISIFYFICIRMINRFI